MLGNVDPYGNTVFGRADMGDLLSDLARVVRFDASPVERRGLDRLRVMAERCRTEAHLHLWFVGD